MTRIVTSHYRYKRPSRKRKAVPLEVPQVVTISDKTRKRVAKPSKSDTVSNSAAASSPSPPSAKVAQVAPAVSANDDRKSVIVTARKPGKRRYADVPEVTEEEHRAIGDRADALMQEFKRQIADKLRKP